MGMSESKDLSKEMKLFPPEERTLLEENFQKLCGGIKKDKIEKKIVEIYVKNLLMMPDVDFLARRICDLMTGQIPTINTITYEGYVHCAALMINGMVEEKAGQVMYLASGKKGSSVPYESCIQFCKLVIQITFHILMKSQAIRSWDGSCSHVLNDESVDRLALALSNELEETETGCDTVAACRWISMNPQFTELLDLIAHHIFQIPLGKGKQLIPLCRGIPAQVYPSWLTLADIFLINSALQPEYRSEWRFLFSSRIHGESFSSLMGKIIDKGPSIIVVKDLDGHIFGGFASSSWTLSPQFSGTSKNFVFSLAPKMVVYQSTGFNDHYQYLNIQQQTFPNGLGMGGQLDYFGFWIDSEYGVGKCSPSCTTFNCPQLSKKPVFSIDRIEVWAVGPEPTNDDEEMEPRASILDVDVEGTAMLRMLNRGPVSEGLRDTPTSDEPEDKQLYVTMP